MKNQTARSRTATKSSVPAEVHRAVETALAIDPKWRWHYLTLVRLRDRLVEDKELRLSEAVETIEPCSVRPGDNATDEFDHDLALALLAREESALAQVNLAIDRILKGTYGVCEDSGRKIPALRLRAIPWCRYTREVEDQFEKTRR